MFNFFFRCENQQLVLSIRATDSSAISVRDMTCAGLALLRHVTKNKTLFGFPVIPDVSVLVFAQSTRQIVAGMNHVDASLWARKLILMVLHITGKTWNFLLGFFFLISTSWTWQCVFPLWSSENMQTRSKMFLWICMSHLRVRPDSLNILRPHFNEIWSQDYGRNWKN